MSASARRTANTWPVRKTDLPRMVAAVHTGTATRHGHMANQGPRKGSTMSFTLYTFTTSTDEEASAWSTMDRTEAETYGRVNQFKVIANTYEFTGSEVHEDFSAPEFHYHIGSNAPGYSPQGDPTCVLDDLEQAREALDADLSLTADGMPECASPEADGAPCGRDDCDGCTGYAQVETAHRELKDASNLSEGISFPISDGRALPVHYWIERVPAGDCDLNEE